MLHFWNNQRKQVSNVQFQESVLNMENDFKNSNIWIVKNCKDLGAAIDKNMMRPCQQHMTTLW